MPIEPKANSDFQNYSGNFPAGGKALKTITSLVDENGDPISSANPLNVDATFTGTLSVNLDSANDEVTVYGSSDGGTTRQVVHTDASGDLQVDILSIAAGENHLGSIGGNTFTLAVTQVTNASAYEAGDAVGGKITITDAMRVSGGTGFLQSIQIIDKGNQKAALELLIFDSDPTAATITDDTAFAYSTDLSKQIARISIGAADYATIDGKASVSMGGLSRTLKASGSANLYAALVTTGTPTYTSTSDIIVTFGIIQD